MPRNFDLRPYYPRTDARMLRQAMRILPEPIARQFAEHIKRKGAGYPLIRPLSIMLTDMLEEAGVEREEARKMADELLEM